MAARGESVITEDQQRQYSVYIHINPLDNNKVYIGKKYRIAGLMGKVIKNVPILIELLKNMDGKIFSTKYYFSI